MKPNESCSLQPRLVLAAILFAGLSVTTPARAESSRWLLAGGHLPACSSYAESACVTIPDWPEDAFRARHFRASQQAAARWASAFEGRLDRETVSAVVTVVDALAKSSAEIRSGRGFADAFRATRVESNDAEVSISGADLYDRLPDRPWNALLDFSEIPSRELVGGQKTEYVALGASESEAARDIYQLFVRMAGDRGDERPRVAVSTAASRNPYEALDYYSAVFEQAGAEVIWLPLDAALRAARDAGECDRLEEWQARILGVYDRARVSPERFALQQRYCRTPEVGLALLGEIDALFLNGGDQSFTRAAFLEDNASPSPELALIRHRLEDGELLLGGTSAGTAVQSTDVMIANGAPDTALLEGAIEGAPPPRGCGRNDSCPRHIGESRLTWRNGGIGTFPIGVLDTHFTERWRQLRMIQLLVETNQRYGIGIDETTAMVGQLDRESGELELSGRGAGSVWVFDLDDADVQSVRPLDISGIRLTRIREGGTVVLTPAAGVDFSWPMHTERSDRPEPECKAVDLDDDLPVLLQPPLLGVRCLEVSIDQGRLLMQIRPVSQEETEAVSHFMVRARLEEGSRGPGG